MRALTEEERAVLERVSELLDESEEFDSISQHGRVIILTQDDVELTLTASAESKVDDEDEDDEEPEIRGVEET